jgi:hypothetical protein
LEIEHDATKRMKRIAKSLKSHREDWEPHYEVLEKHFSPRRGYFADDPVNNARSQRGKMLNQTLIDGTPLRALRILKSGLQAGITSPARPWFRLQTVNPEKRKNEAVREWLAKVEYEMRRLADRSGIYNTLHTGYGDLGVYGTEAALIEDHNDFDLRSIQLVPGSYWLGSTQENRIDTLYREFDLTVNQIVGKFVFKGQRTAKPEWGVVSKQVKEMYDKGDVGEHIKTSQLIMPRYSRDPDRQDGANKPIASQYWMCEADGSGHKGNYHMMGDLGYDDNPISASRWDVAGYDTYGRSPAMEALPDVKELFAKRRDYMEMLRRLNRPPMNAHSDLRNSAFSLMPGAVNFMQNPDKGLVPSFQVNPQLGPVVEDIESSKDAIWSGMYADLFMMISQLDRRQITATEIDERREEKLIALGPVLERLHFEKLKPLVERLFQRVQDSGIAGPPPSALDGEEVEIDFVSMLAQAQKAVATGSMERLAGFIGNMAAVKPQVLDKWDEDAAVNEYADMLGVPPSVVRSDDEANKIRAERQKQEAQMAQAEMMQQVAGAANQGAQAAKVMSEADSPRGAAPGDVLAKAGLA